MSKPKEIKTIADLGNAVKRKVLRTTITEAIENKFLMEILTSVRGSIEEKVDKVVIKPLEREIEKIEEDKRPILIEAVAECLRKEGIL